MFSVEQGFLGLKTAFFAVCQSSFLDPLRASSVNKVVVSDVVIDELLLPISFMP